MTDKNEKDFLNAKSDTVLTKIWVWRNDTQSAAVKDGMHSKLAASDVKNKNTSVFVLVTLCKYSSFLSFFWACRIGEREL